MRHLFSRKDKDSHDFWMSYTDLMSGFLVVFIVICVSLFKHYSMKLEEANNAQEQAMLSREEAETLKNRYNEAMEELQKKEIDLEKAQSTLESLKEAELKNLILRYKDVFVNDENVKVDFDTIRGSIKLTNRVAGRDLFMQDKNPIMRDELKRYLTKIGKPLIARSILLDKERENGSIELRIEGHTDPTWEKERGSDYSYMRNLELSSGRANLVYKYIFENCKLSPAEKEFAKKNMISIGYSFSDRVSKGNINSINEDPMSRRIEFRIIEK